MQANLVDQQWLIIAIIFFGIIAYIAWRRWRERQWIKKRFGNERVHAISFGIGYYGRASDDGIPRRCRGFLILFSDRLFFRSHSEKLEITITGDSITRIHHGYQHKGVDLHQSVMKIDFRMDDQVEDTVAFKVPYPPQWMRMIEYTLLGNNGIKAAEQVS